jgi:hypothetical protein
MTRRLLFTTLVLLPALFLVMLGMRNPALEHNSGPKQRPRAVLENVVKVSVDASQLQTGVDAAAIPAVPVAPSRSLTVQPFVEQAAFHSSAPVCAARQSRAPPAIAAA